jgi:alkanesulfonate monooxygenase SsuD/methylene tetrahydromethanopterin reductase-like flavin-dependent oxidoreductase (luciferase family)
MLDRLACGWFYWGIDGGTISMALALFSLYPSRPAEVRARSAEALEVLLKLWASEGQFHCRGKFFNPEWDHRSLQLLREDVGPRLADLGQS